MAQHPRPVITGSQAGMSLTMQYVSHMLHFALLLDHFLYVGLHFHGDASVTAET